jgi:hypothetical protein
MSLARYAHPERKRADLPFKGGLHVPTHTAGSAESGSSRMKKSRLIAAAQEATFPVSNVAATSNVVVFKPTQKILPGSLVSRLGFLKRTRIALCFCMCTLSHG